MNDKTVIKKKRMLFEKENIYIYICVCLVEILILKIILIDNLQTLFIQREIRET